MRHDGLGPRVGTLELVLPRDEPRHAARLPGLEAALRPDPAGGSRGAGSGRVRGRGGPRSPVRRGSSDRGPLLRRFRRGALAGRALRGRCQRPERAAEPRPAAAALGRVLPQSGGLRLRSRRRTPAGTRLRQHLHRVLLRRLDLADPAERGLDQRGRGGRPRARPGGPAAQRRGGVLSAPARGSAPRVAHAGGRPLRGAADSGPGLVLPLAQDGRGGVRAGRATRPVSSTRCSPPGSIWR